MRKKLHVIMYSFMGVALAVAVLIAVSYGAKAQRFSRALEDDYSRRVMEAQEHLQAIALKLGKARVAGDPTTLAELLSGISRQADGVVAGLSSLPLSHAAMGGTIKFCNQLADYSASLMPVAAAGGGLSADDDAQLGELQSQCSLLIGQFVTARSAMLNESLRLAGGDNVYYAEAQLAERPLEQVADADNGMDYPSMIYDGAFSDARHSGTPKAVSKRRIDAAEAVDIAREYVGASRVKSAVPAAGAGGALEAHGVTLTLVDGVVLSAEVTVEGGAMLWMIPEHAAFEAKLSVDECEARALEFLSSHGYGAMEANHYQVYDGLAVINFVAVQDGVPLYPDLVKLQMRMDTGEVVGLEANNYLMNHEKRASLTPDISKQSALERVSPKLGATDVRLCVIPYKDGEALCYEAIGVYDGREYRVYIDARTGEEREILVMVDTADGVLSA